MTEITQGLYEYSKEYALEMMEACVTYSSDLIIDKS